MFGINDFDETLPGPQGACGPFSHTHCALDTDDTKQAKQEKQWTAL